MTQIKKILDKQGDEVFIRTSTKAVVDDNGYTAESRLQAMQDEINQAQLEVGAVPSDLIPVENSTNWVTSNGIYTTTPSNYQTNKEIDLDICDIRDNVLARFSDGHIETKLFNSRYVNTNIRPIKKAVFMGDSITHGVYSYWSNELKDDEHRYNGFDLNVNFSSQTNANIISLATEYKGIHYYFSQMLCCDVVNLARRGSGYVQDGRNCGNFTDLIFGNASKTNGGIEPYDFSDTDLVCVFLGINDYIHGDTISVQDIQNSLQRGVTAILESNPLCKVVIFSPYNSWGQVSKGGDYTSNAVYGDSSTNYALGYNLGGGTLQDYVDGIDDTCKYIGIQHVPLSNSNVCNRITIKNIMIDGLHPTKDAYIKLAAEIYGKINYGN